MPIFAGWTLRLRQRRAELETVLYLFKYVRHQSNIYNDMTTNMPDPRLHLRSHYACGITLHLYLIDFERLTVARLLNKDIAAYLGAVGYIARYANYLDSAAGCDWWLSQNSRHHPGTPARPARRPHSREPRSRLFRHRRKSPSTILRGQSAREHNRHNRSIPQAQPVPGAGPPPVLFNASAAAVSGIWLVILIFAISFVQSVRPQLKMGGINFAVIVVVTSSIAPIIPNMRAATEFAARVLVVNVVGVAVASILGLVIWPSTNTSAAKDSVVDIIGCVEGCLAVRTAFLKDLYMTARRTRKVARRTEKSTCQEQWQKTLNSAQRDLLLHFWLRTTDCRQAPTTLSTSSLSDVWRLPT